MRFSKVGLERNEVKDIIKRALLQELGSMISQNY